MTIVIFFKLLKNLDLKSKTKKKEKHPMKLAQPQQLLLLTKKNQLELSWFLSKIFEYTN